MTRNSNARIAGVAYLLYIAADFPAMIIYGRATRGDGVAARVAAMAAHAADVRLTQVLTLIGAFCALALGVSLWGVTRDEDPHIATFAMACRIAEGIAGAVGITLTTSLLAMATATGPAAPDPAALHAIATFVFRQDFLVSATFFTVGSTLFCWLLLRGRMIPAWLAWGGIAGSAFGVIVLLLQMLRLATGPITQLVWAPIGVFEVVVAIWFLIKGVREPAARAA